MCNKSSNIIRQRRATSKAAAGSCSGLKSSARKTRTKKRKPKYLSLIKLELSPRKKKQVNPQEATNSKNKVPHTTKQQLVSNLILQDGSSDMQDDHVAAAFLFQTATEDASTTLQDLLDTTTTTASSTTTTATTSEDGPLSPSLTFVSTRPRYDVRAAMRRKERDASGERWVSYCEVVKTEQEEEESSSCGGGYTGDGRRGGCGGGDSSGNMMEVQDHGDQKRLVGLKLDYEDILNAWSDKGPLYIQGEGELPLTVPDLHDGSNGLIDGLGHLGGFWTVPEMDGMKMTENVGGADHGRKLAGQREASVLRYKEKRQSRLFSKRIRYEVRKLNAEKRPRLKGRFVKRSGEA